MRFRPPAPAGPLDTAAPAGPMTSPADQACCCVARAVVRVVMPLTADRPHESELLLCGHHYRVSRAALTAAHATVSELPGTADDPDAWFHGDSGYLAKAPVPAT